jgi:hypothetical protein
VADAPAVTTWLRMRSRGDASPGSEWQSVRKPVLAIWRTGDTSIPIRANADALKRALVAGADRDRTFRWFEGGAGYAPGQLEEAARWLGLRLGGKRARPVIQDELPPANAGPGVADVANASVLYAPPVQALWLLIPALMLGLAALRMHRASAPAPASAPPASAHIAFAALAAGVACAACIAAGVAIALHADDAVRELGGTPWPFALALACAAALAVIAGVAARRRAWLVVAGSGLWLALALFWLV